MSISSYFSRPLLRTENGGDGGITAPERAPLLSRLSGPALLTVILALGFSGTSVQAAPSSTAQLPQGRDVILSDEVIAAQKDVADKKLSVQDTNSQEGSVKEIATDDKDADAKDSGLTAPADASASDLSQDSAQGSPDVAGVVTPVADSPASTSPEAAIQNQGSMGSVFGSGATLGVTTARVPDSGMSETAASPAATATAAATAAALSTQTAPLPGQLLKFDSSETTPGSMTGFEMRPSTGAASLGSTIVAQPHLRILVPMNGQSTIPVSYNNALSNLLAKASGFSSYSLSPSQNTPASLACVYQLAPQPSGQPEGCNPIYASVNPSGGGGAIALVDAYDYPTATLDLNYFSRYFNLPPTNFTVIYAGGSSPYISGSKPAPNAGWNLEAALDIEWAHAMAPSAKIFLVEAQNATIDSLFTAVLAAQYLVNANGGGEVSMSWGTTEDVGETAYDAYLSGAPSNVVHVASSGDTGSVVPYPSASPNVISVGGTSLNRDANGVFLSETAWADSGGGVSAYESRPSYQNPSAVQTIVGSARGTPDISMLGDPSTGVAMFSAGQWYIVGGTSLAAPLAAGLLNVAAKHAGSFPTQASTETTLYTNGAAVTDFRDISSGSCGSNSAAVGYDLCTGYGSLISYPYDTSAHAPTDACVAGFAHNKINGNIGRSCSKQGYSAN